MTPLHFGLVSQHRRNVRPYLQPDLSDVVVGPLERLPPVPGAHVTGFPGRFLDHHQQTQGDVTSRLSRNHAPARSHAS